MDLRAPLLVALAALTAGCLGSFEAPASPDLSLPPLVDPAVAPADLTLR